MLPAVAVILALPRAGRFRPMLVQYDELTIRAMRAMRYAAALTVQLRNCALWPEQKVHSSGCASLLQSQCWLDNTAR